MRSVAVYFQSCSPLLNLWNKREECRLALKTINEKRVYCPICAPCTVYASAYTNT